MAELEKAEAKKAEAKATEKKKQKSAPIVTDEDLTSGLLDVTKVGFETFQEKNRKSFKNRTFSWNQKSHGTRYQWSTTHPAQMRNNPIYDVILAIWSLLRHQPVILQNTFLF